MNLLIDSRMISCSGIGTVIKNLISPLSSFPFCTNLILPPNDARLQNTANIPCDASIYSLAEQFVLPKLIPSCDLFWSPHYNIPVLPIKAKKRIVTIHDAYHLRFKGSLGWKEKLYAQCMFRQAVYRSDAVITDSQFSQQELSSLLSIPPSRIHVIYPGVDYERFSRKCRKETLEMIKQKYALPDCFLLFVGNLKSHKNLQLILDAYEKFSIEIPLVILGKKNGLRHVDPALIRIEQTPKLKNQIHQTGEVLDEELPAFYQMAFALIFPSLYEGFGLPPLEAMASGCPAIVSRKASLPEVCEDAACFIDSNDAGELADAIQKIQTDAVYRSLLQEKGNSRAQHFSWEKTAHQYRKLFQEIYFR